MSEAKKLSDGGDDVAPRGSNGDESKPRNHGGLKFDIT
jgi:hypothetical protein